MSGTPFYFVFRIIVPVLLFAAQWNLYKRTLRFVKSFPTFPSWGTRSTTTLFLFFNAAFLILFFLHLSLSEFPKLFLSYAVYPIYIWEGATFFIFLVLSIIRILRLPFEAVFHVGKSFSAINQKIIVMKSTTSLCPVITSSS